jgi:hypothetical protein
MNETKQPGEEEPIPRREWIKGLVFVAVIFGIAIAVPILMFVWLFNGLPHH